MLSELEIALCDRSGGHHVPVVGGETAVDIKAISSGLELGDDGIWYSPENRAVSYPADGNECCFALEDASFWFRHRNDCIATALRSFPPPESAAVFDIGGGNGYVSAGLSAAGFEVVLVEPGRAGAANARRRGIANVICATAETAQFKPRSLSAVGLFDVIEHTDDDVAFLQSIRTLLRPGGRLYATVPAYPCLWSQEDVLAGHFRRYTVKGIAHALKSSGFETEFSSYFFRFLPLPIFLLRTLPYVLRLSRKRPKPAAAARDHAVQGGFLARLADRLLKPELDNLRNKKAMRFGGSCLIVARCLF
jgi:SAM-dependent methyltransferase